MDDLNPLAGTAHLLEEVDSKSKAPSLARTSQLVEQTRNQTTHGYLFYYCRKINGSAA